MDTLVEDKIDSLVEAVAKNTEDITALNFKVDDIRARMVTKDDLKFYATKEDLKAFATKEDLKAFSTKEDLSRVEGKLDGLIEEIRSSRS
jgi:hypothetical protein